MENTLDPTKTGLVLVDLQKDTVPRFAKSPDFLTNVVRILEYTRSVRMPVFLVQTRRHPEYIDEAKVITEQSLKGGATHRSQGILAESAPGTDFVDELRRQPGDFVIDKRRGNAFLATNLEMYLRHLQIDTVLVGGISTNAGVENTVRDGKDRDFNMVALSDCCSAKDDEAHDYCMRKVFPRVARVMTADEAIEKLMKGP